jgi:ABC-2 type transport system ATP-binding protein
VFITTHRLDEAERLCDRVAIMNTNLRTIGRPDELRRTLFSRSIALTTPAPLPDPERVLAGLPGVRAWRSEAANGSAPPATADAATAQYVLTVDDPVRSGPDLVRALVAAGVDIVAFAELHYSLEDVYLELVDDQEGRSR